MSAAESFSTSPPPDEKDPRQSVFEAIKSGKIAELFAYGTREGVENTITGADSDYVSLTPVPGRAVERDEAAMRAMRANVRQGGEAAVYD